MGHNHFCTHQCGSVQNNNLQSILLHLRGPNIVLFITRPVSWRQPTINFIFSHNAYSQVCFWGTHTHTLLSSILQPGPLGYCSLKSAFSPAQASVADKVSHYYLLRIKVYFEITVSKCELKPNETDGDGQRAMPESHTRQICAWWREKSVWERKKYMCVLRK